MSTSSQQRSGRRQPFGFLNANTVPTASKGSSATADVLGGSAVDPFKTESKKKFRGVLKSIVTRSTGKKKERAAGSGSSDDDVSRLESPTKKTRVGKKDTAAPAAASALELPASQEQRCSESHTDFIFRETQVVQEEPGFWSDKIEELLELKLANPVNDDEDDVIEAIGHRADSMVGPVESLASELGQNETGEPILWSSRVKEDNDGFKIHHDAVVGVFRKMTVANEDAGFWSEEIEGMLALKQANPITEDEDAIENHNQRKSDGRAGPFESLSTDLDENVSGVPISWSSRVVEDKDGFKIHIDP